MRIERARSERVRAHEELDERMAEVLRAKSHAERLAMVDAMWESVTAIMRHRVRTRHPEWTDAEVAAEAGRMLLHAAD